MEKLKVGTYVCPNRDKVILHEIRGYTNLSTVLYSFDDEKAKYRDCYESVLSFLKRHNFKHVSPDWD